ncbi:fluoride efflux transporter FluC [Paenibacillaceae bacterium WGS1546]|uniref:fluoride efflux transporter FluC n=1 Tax=Cohnella sp. WGS1546 TaxID=3366810 RepID=UPI00372CFC1C
MTIGSLVGVAAGGFLGACARYGWSAWMNRRFPAVFPHATLFINLSGSFALGLLYGADAGETILLWLGAGFMGAYTTFSTFNAENVQLAQNKKWKTLAVYLGTSYLLGILLAYAGFEAGAFLFA